MSSAGRSIGGPATRILRSGRTPGIVFDRIASGRSGCITMRTGSGTGMRVGGLTLLVVATVVRDAERGADGSAAMPLAGSSAIMAAERSAASAVR